MNPNRDSVSEERTRQAALDLWNVNVNEHTGRQYILERPDGSGSRPFIERRSGSDIEEQLRSEENGEF
jgi:hypothetical protein